MELEFFASCLPGLEQALADELKTLGVGRVRPLGGGAAFFSEAETAMRACLWSRVAARVLLVVGRVNAADAALLYAGVYDLPWENVLAPDATMAVRAYGVNVELRNTRFTALKVKDAIVDRLRSVRGDRPVVDSKAPRAAVDVRVRENRATISLDFSGEALGHRDYLAPDEREDASLSCSMAAAALTLAEWAEYAKRGAAFFDPACRDGIMLAEAALIAADCAPGLNREKWGFKGWAGFDGAEWKNLLIEARMRAEEGLVRIGGEAAVNSPDGRPDPNQVRFIGASTSSPLITRARNHMRHAGVQAIVSVEIGSAEDIAGFFSTHKALRHAPLVFVASNIDASSRGDSPAHVQADESAFVAACAKAPKGSRFVAVGAQDLDVRFGTASEASRTVGKGRVETSVSIYDQAPTGGATIEVPDRAGGAPHSVTVFEQTSSQFAARLRKTFKERRKWATRAGVTCYRLYDADLPDYAVAIDWYTGAGDARGNDYLHIAEYAPPASIDPDKARRRFCDVLAIAPVVCGIRPDHVFSKTRMRDKGGSQYRNAGQRAYVTTIEEGGYRFEVDLAARLDTGLFLDHRLTRALVGEKACDARFLNLFAYTGTASVYAAGGGARSTVTVDLSSTYLDWARRNMAANGFAGSQHVFERGDVVKWITDARRSGRRFDLIFVDPPTFSNSKAMGKRTWDVQRDHAELLIGVSRLLSEGGEAIFSCNLRSFKPDVATLERYGVQIEDISLSTIPEDYVRTPKIHKCYLVHHV